MACVIMCRCRIWYQRLTVFVIVFCFKDGETALDVAKRNGYESVVKLLEAAENKKLETNSGPSNTVKANRPMIVRSK